MKHPFEERIVELVAERDALRERVADGDYAQDLASALEDELNRAGYSVDAEHSIGDQLAAVLLDLSEALDARRERNATAASVLGGTVEGKPTSPHNWMQRARALVEIERERDALRERVVELEAKLAAAEERIQELEDELLDNREAFTRYDD